MRATLHTLARTENEMKETNRPVTKSTNLRDIEKLESGGILSGVRLKCVKVRAPLLWRGSKIPWWLAALSGPVC